MTTVQSRLHWNIGFSTCFLGTVIIILSGCQSPRHSRQVIIKPGPANPKTASDYVRWANYNSNQKNRDAAIENYTQAIALEPDTEKRCGYIVTRGLLRYNEYQHSIDSNAVQDIAGAEKDFNEAIRLCPENTEARWVRGHFYTNTRYPEKGIEDYNFLIAHEPTNASYWFMRSAAYAVSGDLELALSDASKAITVAKSKSINAAFYYQRRAWIHNKFGNFENAIQDLDKSVSLAKGLTKCPSLLMKGAILEEQGQMTAAIAAYEKCISVCGVIPVGNLAGRLGYTAGVNMIANLGKEALINPHVMLGAGIGMLIRDMINGDEKTDLATIYRDDAKRQIERIRTAQAISQ